MKVDAEGAGLDEGRLERIGQHLRSRYIEPGKIAGAQVAIVRDGTVGYFESFGQQDRERAVPVADDAIWRLYSMTKPITGVAMMTLYERGHFQLDDPVERWIPEWRNMTVREPDPNGGSRIVPAHRPPTIRDILTHTSGIGYGEGNDDLVLGERNWLAGHDLQIDGEAFRRVAAALPARAPTGCTRTAWTSQRRSWRSCRDCRTTSTCAPPCSPPSG
jgi:CubicO group peptidase (beta-lactamase class C family)